jgi:hypothetical protein
LPKQWQPRILLQKLFISVIINHLKQNCMVANISIVFIQTLYNLVAKEYLLKPKVNGIVAKKNGMVANN